MPLPKEFSEARPNPMGDQVSSALNGRNACSVANEIAVEQTPIEKHPAWLKPDSMEVQDQSLKLSAAKSRRAFKLREFDRYCELIRIRSERVQDRESTNDLYLACQASSEALAADCSQWPGVSRFFEWQKTFRERVLDTVATREAARHLPKSIEKLDEQIKAFDDEIERLEKTYGFTKA